MLELKTVKNALSIDRTEKQWPVRFLFLSIFFIEICSVLWPLGNPDMLSMESWMRNLQDSVMSANSAHQQYSVNRPGRTDENFTFLFFLFLKYILYLFFIIYASCLYIGEQKKMTTGEVVRKFFRRMPVLLFFLLLLLSSVFLFSFNSAEPRLTGFFLLIIFLQFLYPVLFLVIPFVILAPSLMIMEKRNLLDAFRYSVRYTKGKRFKVFFHIFTVYLIYQLARTFLSVFASRGSIGEALLNSFLLAYFFCSTGRLVGIYYYKTNISEIFV